eukprot:TRINITY_DN110339_c0_g1_i1.p1 TRINITY_DN110339_c0_g1~~TRINITY_DN110339_c0_g1_i1.p1  ORF type:complete len:389 (-),score=38.32 TRINITY_DN110339_c0_g1_i1:42-1208(-)
MALCRCCFCRPHAEPARSAVCAADSSDESSDSSEEAGLDAESGLEHYAPAIKSPVEHGNSSVQLPDSSLSLPQPEESQPQAKSRLPMLTGDSVVSSQFRWESMSAVTPSAQSQFRWESMGAVTPGSSGSVRLEPIRSAGPQAQLGSSFAGGVWSSAPAIPVNSSIHLESARSESLKLHSASSLPGKSLSSAPAMSASPQNLSEIPSGRLPLPASPFVSNSGMSLLGVSSRCKEDAFPPGMDSNSTDEYPNLFDGVVNGCACEYDLELAEKRGALRHDDPIHEYYKQDGWWASLVGDTKTRFCHHFTSLSRGGQFAVRAAKLANLHFQSEEEIWKFLGKAPCCGKFEGSGTLLCKPCEEKGRDNTCSPETCLFLASYLPCPVPAWAYKL